MSRGVPHLMVHLGYGGASMLGMSFPAIIMGPEHGRQ
jgi:hypothetical protein